MLIRTLTAAITAATLSGSLPALAQETVTFRVFDSRGGVSAHELAQELGYFENTPVRLESLGVSSGGPESLMALAGGSADIAGPATAAGLNSIAAGNDFVLVLPSNGIDEQTQSRFYVLDDSQIKSVKDLKGKTIAVNTLGAHLDYTIREALKQNGLQLSDVNLVVMPGPQLETALRAGQIDVAAIGYWQPAFDGKLHETGGVREVFNDTQIIGSLVGGFQVFDRKFVNAHPDALRAYIEGSVKAADWARENPEEARAVVARIFEARGEDPDLAKYWRGLGLRPGSLVEPRDLTFWIERLEAEGTVPKGKLDAAALLAPAIPAAPKS